MTILTVYFIMQQVPSVYTIQQECNLGKCLDVVVDKPGHSIIICRV